MAMCELLREHGTCQGTLPPSAVYNTAVHDLRVRELNAEDSGRRPYAFHRKHVHEATGAKHLLELALGDTDIGVRSAEINTRLLYSSPELLRGALTIAAEREAA